MLSLPKPAVLRDVLLLRNSLTESHMPLRLPDTLPDVKAFWAARHVGDGPLPDLATSLQPVETTEEGTVYRFAFPSRVITSDAINNIVPGCYYVPSPSASGRAAPFLLLLHTNGCQDWSFEAWHAGRLMKQGCQVAHITLPYQMERRPQRLDFSPHVMRSDLSQLLRELSQAVCDAADVLRWARAEGATRVMVAGWSLGGLVAALVATQIPLDAALLVEPSVNLAWSIAHRRWFSWHSWQSLRRAGLSQAVLERWLAPVLPMNLRPQVPQAGLRILAARYDLLVGYQQVLTLWRSWGQPALNVQPTGHINLLFTAALPDELDQLALGH